MATFRAAPSDLASRGQMTLRRLSFLHHHPRQVHGYQVTLATNDVVPLVDSIRRPCVIRRQAAVVPHCSGCALSAKAALLWLTCGSERPRLA
jgi:hypothetical protein